MGNQKWDFNKEAASWDANPARVKLANDIAGAISEQGILKPDMNVLDFGCGTGLLTLLLQPLVRSITAADNSPGMLEVLNKKIEKSNLANVSPLYLNLENGDRIEGCFDLIVSSMALHHIRETRPLLDKFHRACAPGGYLCIADLDPDYGRFHGENDTVFHCGFDRAELGKTFIEAGFSDIRDQTAANVIKPAPDGEMSSFSVFLMTGRKSF